METNLITNLIDKNYQLKEILDEIENKALEVEIDVKYKQLINLIKKLCEDI